MPPSSHYRAGSLRTRDSPSLRRCLRKSRRQQGCRSGSPTSCFCRCQMPPSSIKESRLFGRTDRSGTGVYHFRPFGRPQIEAYFGGPLAAELEAAGEAAFADFGLGGGPWKTFRRMSNFESCLAATAAGIGGLLTTLAVRSPVGWPYPECRQV